MSEKDIKIKPKQSPKSNSSANMPKVAVKSKDAVVSTVKDAKAVMKDTLVKKAVESKLGTEQGYSEPQKADTEASERVENAVYTTADTVYHKGKTFTQNRIKEHRQKVKTRESEAPEHQEPTLRNRNETSILPLTDAVWYMHRNVMVCGRSISRAL